MSRKAPDIRYGRLLEAAHISGYSFERLCGELEWLLDGDRWQAVGPGYDDVNDFLRSIDLSPFNLGENRKGLHQRIKELQPDASTRAIADMTGASQATVFRDLKADSNESAEGEDTDETPETNGVTDSNESAAPPPPPAHPHSDLLVRWLGMVQGETHVIRVERGGLPALLSERGKWDWRRVRSYVLPALEGARDTIDQYIREITDALETKRG